MRLEQAATPTFARHETFHPRFSWFRKAYVAARRDPDVFSKEDAPLTLGVGKNMVRSIRFWGLASKLLVEAKHPTQARSPRVVASRVGCALLGADGADPYMENPGTWWWLHWLMVSPGSDLPVWWVLLNDMNAVEFDEDEALAVVSNRIENSSWDCPNASSLAKDISAFVRTYGEPPGARTERFDDRFGCPLRELGLLTQAASRKGFRLATSRQPGLPLPIIAAAIFDFIALTKPGSNTMLLTRLATEPGGPGRCLRVEEGDLMMALEDAQSCCADIALTTPGGSLQVAWTADPATMAGQILSAYFGADASLIGSHLAGHAAREAVDPQLSGNGIFNKLPEAVMS